MVTGWDSCHVYIRQDTDIVCLARMNGGLQVDSSIGILGVVQVLYSRCFLGRGRRYIPCLLVEYDRDMIVTNTVR